MNVRKFWGNTFMVLGGCLAVFAGGCGMIFEVMSFFEPSGGEHYLTPMLPLVIGGVPALIGVGLFFLGRWIKRGKAPPPTSGSA